MSFTPHEPFVTPYEGNFSARNPPSQSTSVSPWERSTNELLHQTLFQLQRPPSNPQGLPQWALRPRPLDLELLTHLDFDVDDWQFVTSDMMKRATSRQFVKPNLLDQQPKQALAATQQSITGRTFTDGTGEAEEDAFDESEIGGQDKSEKQHGGSTGNKQLSDHGSRVEDKSGPGEDFTESEDEGQQSEEEEHFDTSDDEYIHARDGAEEAQPRRTSKGKSSQLPLGLNSSKALDESHDAVFPVLEAAQLPPPDFQAILRVGEAEGGPVVTRELDQVLSAIEDGKGRRSRQKAGSSYSRLLKEQERLWTQFQARNIKRRTLDEHSSSSDVSISDSESTNRATKRLKTTEDRSAESVHLDSGDYNEQSEIHSASPSSERRCEGPEHRARVPLPTSRPPKVPLVPRHSPITSRGGLKKDKWSDEEDRALIELMVAQRNWETENKVPPNKWLKDVKLYAKISSQLAERGIRRSGNACKNQWNRAGRQKSGFEERPDNGTARAKICSEQKTKKEKERRQTGSRSKIYR